MRSPTTNPREGLHPAKSYGKAVQGWLGPAWHNVPGGGESINEKNSLGENYRNFKPRDLFTRSPLGAATRERGGGEGGRGARTPQRCPPGTRAASGLPPPPPRPTGTGRGEERPGLPPSPPAAPAGGGLLLTAPLPASPCLIFNTLPPSN